MNKKVDKEKLKEAAEHLEWVLSRHGGDDTIETAWKGLAELIEKSKNMKIDLPIDNKEIPCRYIFGNGDFEKYRDPNLGDAYVEFSVELRGGYSDLEKKILNKLHESMMKGENENG